MMKPLLKTVAICVGVLYFSSCGAGTGSELSGDVGKTPTNNTKKKQSENIKPKKDPNICYSDMSRLEKLVFSFENYEAPDAERVTCLSSAVKGIGKSTAEKLLESKELSIAPRNFDQFRALMNNLEQKGFTDIYNNTVEEFGDDNLEIFVEISKEKKLQTNEIVYFVESEYIYRGNVRGFFPDGSIAITSSKGYKHTVSDSDIARTFGCVQKSRYCVKDVVTSKNGATGKIVAVLPSKHSKRVIWLSSKGYYNQSSIDDLALQY